MVQTYTLYLAHFAIQKKSYIGDNLHTSNTKCCFYGFLINTICHYSRTSNI